MSNPPRKYVFIAAGIGITPFRSMIQYMVDKKNSVPTTLFYVAQTSSEFIFKDLFEKAHNVCGLKTIYILSKDRKKLDEALIEYLDKDSSQTIFYVSGPQAMVEEYRDLLQQMNINTDRIKTDLFSGYEDYSNTSESLNE